MHSLASILSEVKNGKAPDKGKKAASTSSSAPKPKPSTAAQRVTKKSGNDTTSKAARNTSSTAPTPANKPAANTSSTASKAPRNTSSTTPAPANKPAAKSSAKTSSSPEKPAWKPPGKAPATPRSSGPAPVQRAAKTTATSAPRPTSSSSSSSSGSGRAARPASSSSSSSSGSGRTARPSTTPPSSQESTTPPSRGGFRVPVARAASPVAPRQPPRSAHGPTRIQYHDTWESLTLAELQDEARWHGLPLYKKNDREYIAKLMAVDDRAFCDCFNDLTGLGLTLEELRNMADTNGALLDSQMYDDVVGLMIAISRKVARVEVLKHNNELRKKEEDETDSSASSTLSKSSGVKQPKGKKRSRSDDQDVEESKPAKKSKTSPSDENDKTTKPTPAPKDRKIAKGKSLLPRPMLVQSKKGGTKSSGEDVEMSDDSESTKGIARVKKPMKTSSKRSLRSNKLAEEFLELPNDEMEGVEQDSEDEEVATEDAEQDMDIDDWIVDDVPKPKTKRKSGTTCAKMARSGLVSGMR